MRAIINVFDVQRSSEIKHERTKYFFLDVFRSFSDICMQGYQHNPLKARAFRLTETGDGFISSIGYPFIADNPHSLADHAVETALIMSREFNAEVERFGYGNPIKAAMGLAFNSVQGNFQSSDIKSYDLFGDALIQTYRYEEMRKLPAIEHIIHDHALSLGMSFYIILIVQEVIYNSLKPEYKALFRAIDLREIGHVIRVDIDARYVFFHVLPLSGRRRGSPLQPAQHALPGPFASRQTGRQQIAPGGRLPVQHLSRKEDSWTVSEHQRAIELREGDATGRADRLVERPRGAQGLGQAFERTG